MINFISGNFKFYLLILSIYHIFSGGISVFVPNFALKFYNSFYKFNIDPEENKKLLLTFKPWGSAIFILGVLGIFAFFNPTRYIGIILGLLILLMMRVSYRFIFRYEIKKEFKTPLNRNYANIILLFYGIFSITFWIIKTYLLK